MLTLSRIIIKNCKTSTGVNLKLIKGQIGILMKYTYIKILKKDLIKIR